MTKTYKIKMQKKKYLEYIVEAKNKERAIEKAFEGDYVDVTESEFLLPSSDWEVIDIKIIKDLRGKDKK